MIEIEVTLTSFKDEEVKDVLQEITGSIKDNFPNVSYNNSPLNIMLHQH